MSWLTDVLKLFGIRIPPKKTKGPPHAHYYPLAVDGSNRGGQRYWMENTVYVKTNDSILDPDTKKAVHSVNSLLESWTLPLRLSYVEVDVPLNSCILSVNLDRNGDKVPRNVSGWTGPENMTGNDGKRGAESAEPWRLRGVEVWIRKGIKGDRLFALLLHEIGIHGLGFNVHSDDTRDVGHRDADVLAFTPADGKTIWYCYEWRKIEAGF